MAIKKSELYSSLWASCDELRGGMDASQYKDYVLSMLFIKYVSDKYAGQKFAVLEAPEGATFKDMVALKGTPDIGDQINKKIISRLAIANALPEADFPDFNDSNKLGSGKEMVDRLTNLIAIFENPALDFSKNRADGDDRLGDAYEFLMRHFATESGKSKGQFYTPGRRCQGRGAGGSALHRVLHREHPKPNTRMAYARAVYQFMAWAEERRLPLERLNPIFISVYSEQLQQHMAPFGNDHRSDRTQGCGALPWLHKPLARKLGLPHACPRGRWARSGAETCGQSKLKGRSMRMDMNRKPWIEVLRTVLATRS